MLLFISSLQFFLTSIYIYIGAANLHPPKNTKVQVSKLHPPKIIKVQVSNIH